MTTVKEWLDKEVWMNGILTMSVINKDELSKIVERCIAATQPQWVSVEDRLPYDDERVLVSYVFDGFVFRCIAMIVCGTFTTDGSDFGTLKGVTHWMPLPPGPEDK